MRNIEKVYRGPPGLHAIAPLSVELRAGQAVSVVGPSGCGKSTLMRLIAGLDAPTRGDIRIGSAPVADRCPTSASSSSATCCSNGARDGQRHAAGGDQGPRRPGRRAPGELLQEFDVAGFAKSYPWQLSGGMRQRVAIARALLTRPALLFLDEPFSALDALTRDQMNVLLQRVQTSEGVTTLLITHSITEAIFCADRVLVMSGRPGRSWTISRAVRRPRRLAVRETSEFTAIGRRIREHFEKVGVLVG